MSENEEDVITSIHQDLPAKLTDLDRMTLDLAKERRNAVLAEAKFAVSKGENAELAYRYQILSLYLKYNLNQNDAINPETGDIVYGANKQKV